METIYCQSCGMPLAAPEEHGTEKDGSPNPEYCTHCYEDGHFTRDVSMEEMIDHCMKFLGEFNKGAGVSLNPQQARAEMQKRLPGLKRWKRRKEGK